MTKKMRKRYDRWLGRGIPATRRGRNLVIRGAVNSIAWYMVQAQTPPRLEEMMEEAEDLEVVYHAAMEAFVRRVGGLFKPGPLKALERVVQKTENDCG